MKKLKFKLFLFFAIIAISANTFAQKEVKKTFGSKEKIKISTVSGDCIISKSENEQIQVKLTYSYPDDCFEFEVSDEGNYIRIKEEFDGKCSGDSRWEISLPENTNVEYNSASGNLELSDIKKGLEANTASGNMKLSGIAGEIELNTASGNISIEKSSGEIKINSASGDIKLNAISGIMKISTASGSINAIQISNDYTFNVASGSISINHSRGKGILNSASGDISLNNSTGIFNLKAASGNISAEMIELSGNSEMATASGAVLLKLAKTPAHNLSLSAASGDVTLDYGGNEINGYFEFMARKEKGRIISPIKFDKEETVRIDGNDFDKKMFTRGSSTPVILLKTSSGTVKLIK